MLKDYLLLVLQFQFEYIVDFLLLIQNNKSLDLSNKQSQVKTDIECFRMLFNANNIFLNIFTSFSPGH